MTFAKDRTRKFGFAACYIIGGLMVWHVSCMIGLIGDDSMLATPSMRRRLGMDDEEVDSDAFGPGQEYMVVFCLLGVSYMFLALAIIVDEFFVPALEAIADEWELSPDIAGATLMAAGGSAPELFTSLIGTFKKSDVGFGTIVGSAVFNVLFVIGCCAIFSPDELSLTWWPLFRDCVYYTISLVTLALFFSCGPNPCNMPGYKNVTSSVTVANVTTFTVVQEKLPLKIQLYEACILFSMYFGYVWFMKHNQAARMWVLRVIVRDPLAQSPRDPHGVGDATPTKSVSNPVARASEDEAVAEIGSNGAIVLAAKATYSDDGDVHIQSPAEKKMARASIGVHVNYPRASNFRAGMLRIMLSDKSLLDRTGFSAVRSLPGDVNATFAQIDYKKQGYIDKDELKKFLEEKADAKDLSEEALCEVFDAIDQDKDKKISETEFQTWYYKADQSLRMDIVSKFKKYDKNGDSKIDATELAALLEDLGVQEITDDVVQGFIADLDKNKDGAIQEDEFVQWYQKQPFYATDKPMDGEDEPHEPMDPFEIPGHLRGQIFWAVSLPLVLTMYYTVPDVQVPGKEKYKFFAFGFSILWIGVYSFAMVDWATRIGATLGIPPAVMGLTFLAAGTSVPDLLSSVVVALKGEGDMAVSSSIGSNIFDVLVGLPFPWILYILIEGEPVEVKAESLGLSIVILIMMLVTVVALIMCSGWKITKPLGYSMFCLYGLFVTQDLLRSYNVGPFGSEDAEMESWTWQEMES